MLLENQLSLRRFLLTAAESSGNEGVRARLTHLTNGSPTHDLKRLLHQTSVALYYSRADPFPRVPWSANCGMILNELITHVIERLLIRRRRDPEDFNLLTLGYREASPGSTGHRLAMSNTVMCYYPNTLVAALKQPQWVALHQQIGDDLMIHLLLNYCVFIKTAGPNGSFIQLAGKSIRWMKRTNVQSTTTPLKPTAPMKVDPTKDAQAAVTINQVMYARQFRKRRIFSKCDIEQTANNLTPATRGQAARLVRKIFREPMKTKRLPGRLIKLVPLVQEVLQRFRSVKMDEIIDKMVPVRREVLDLIRGDYRIRNIMSTSKCSTPSTSVAIGRHASMLASIDEDGYISQPESPSSAEARKRKRREEVIESLSNASEAQGPTRKQRRRVHFDQATVKPADDSAPSLGIDQLAQLQRHRHQITELLQYDVAKDRVERLVLRVVSVIVPKSMWGDAPTKGQSSNWKLVRAFISRLVRSKKYDTISIKKVAAAFPVKSIQWMNASGHSQCPPNELKKRQQMMSQLLTWTTQQIIFPLLRNVFYITESEGSANEVFYYPRFVWDVISALAMYDLTSFTLHPTSAVDASLAARTLAVSRLRLLPKVTGVRPLMNLSGATVAAGSPQTSVNKSLELVHRALLFEIERQSTTLLGSTVRNLDEIAAKLSEYLQTARSCALCHSASHQFYCVAVDVERCFDTIRPKKLLRILKKVFIEDEYLVRKHWVCKDQHFKMERPAFASGDLQPFPGLVEQIGRKPGAVFVDGVLYDYISKAKILALLKEHLLANTVQANDQLFQQRQGIPQGSVLSTTLCNLYYAHYEKRVLNKLLASETGPRGCSHDLMMRYTDDFFYVTTDLAGARRFTEVIHRGNEDYGCFVNFKKSRVNFPVSVATSDGDYAVPQIQQLAIDDSAPVIAWCGLLIDPQTMQVYINFDKLRLSVIAASIPVDDTKRIGASIVNKVLAAVRQRWHRVYFDPAMLDRLTIQVNAYQLMCLAVLRFVLLVDKLQQSANSNAFLYDTVSKITRKNARGIHRAMKSKDTHRVASLPAVDLEVTVQLIGLHAFITVITAAKISARSCARGDQWEKLLRRLTVDRTRLAVSGCQWLPSPPELAAVVGHPRNAPITRWLDAYRANFNRRHRHQRGGSRG